MKHAKLFPIDVIRKKYYIGKRTEATIKEEQRLCIICGRKDYYARGWCRKHYATWLKYGNPLYRKIKKNPLCRLCDKPRYQKARSRRLCQEHYYEFYRPKWKLHWAKNRDKNVLASKLRYLRDREKRLKWQNDYYKRKKINNFISTTDGNGLSEVP